MPGVAELGWMTGTWQGESFPGHVLEETWSAPRDGCIGAFVRILSGGALETIELISITEENDSLTLRVQLFDAELKPRMPEPSVQRLIELSENGIVFESVGDGPMKSFGYSRPQPDRFVIAGETVTGGKIHIDLEAVPAK